MSVCIGTTPHPVTVTTRIIPFLVGNPCKPSFLTVTGWGVDLKYVKMFILFLLVSKNTLKSAAKGWNGVSPEDDPELDLKPGKMQWIGAKWPKIDRTKAQIKTHNEIWLVRSNLIYPKPGTRFNSAWKKKTWPRFPRFLHPHRLSTWGSQPKDASPSLPLVWMLQSMEQPRCANSPIAPHLCPGPALRKSLTTRHVKQSPFAALRW